MSFQLEICCYNLASSITAGRAGAHRIELCADPADGGTTPSFGTIKMVKEKVSIDVYPIIRPRGGDFVYDEDEFALMQSDIILCKKLCCEGVVIGMLQPDGNIDKERCKRLVEFAYPMGVTFHRAFDRTSDPFKALEDIIEIGCERILTSGQHPTALEGIQLIRELVRQADDRIIIMPGSGVRSNNVLELAEKTGAIEFHSSASIIAGSKAAFSNPAMMETLTTINADENEIKSITKNLQGYYSMFQKEN